MTTFSYLLTASLYMVVFYGCYWFLLRRNTFFALNRFYLLASIIFSLILPLVEFPISPAVPLPISQVTLPTIVVSNRLLVESGGWSIGAVLKLVYGLGVGFMLLRLMLNVRSVFRIIRRGAVERKGAYLLVRLPDKDNPISSFSFGRYLVLNHSDALLPPPALLRHEEAHIKQLHTLDTLLLEVIRAFFWLNPVLWLYKTALQEIHEFLADRAAVCQLSGDSVEGQATVQPSYAHQLVAYALRIPTTALTTPFATQSTLKQRLLMLQKPLTHRWVLLRYALVLPLGVCLLMCTQSEKDLPLDTHVSTSNQDQAATRRSVKVDGEVFTVVEQQPEFPGGMAKLGNYLSQNLRYPAAAQKVNAEGRVFVSFIVTKTGEVTDVKILKGIGFGTEEEASRVVSQMPRWIPARQNGQLVNVRYNLPINFQLDDAQNK